MKTYCYKCQKKLFSLPDFIVTLYTRFEEVEKSPRSIEIPGYANVAFILLIGLNFLFLQIRTHTRIYRSYYSSSYASFFFISTSVRTRC